MRVTNARRLVAAGSALLTLLAIVLSEKPATAAVTRLLPDNGNCVYSATNLLRHWPAGGPKELWRVKIGDGKAAVLEADGRAFTAFQTNGAQWALCLKPQTGEVLWKRQLIAVENHHVVSGPVTTPIVDGDRVYFIPYDSINANYWYPHCPVYCLRTTDGSEIWHEGEKFSNTEGAIPLILGNTLYLGCSGKSNVLVAVDKTTRKLLWQTAHDSGGKYVYQCGCSLTYAEFGGIPQIISAIWPNDIIGVDTRGGRMLWKWSFPTEFASGICSTPVALGSRLFLSGFQGGTSLGVCLDFTNKEGKLEPAVRYSDKKLQCNAFHTVSIADGAVYGFGRGNEADALQCTDFETGKLIWQKEGADWGRDRQLIIADGLIFAVTKHDELVLAEASPAGYHELGRVAPGIKLGIPQQPTLGNGRLYLRGNDTIVCYEVGNASK